MFSHFSKNTSILIVILFALYSNNLYSQEVKDTIIDADFQYASTLELFHQKQKILFLAGSQSRKYGTIDLSNGQVNCCNKPEKRKTDNKENVTFMGRVTVANEIMAIYWQWDDEQNKISIFSASFNNDVSPLELITRHPLPTKPKSFFFNSSPSNKHLVIGFYTNSNLHVNLMDDELEAAIWLEYPVTIKQKRTSVMRSYLSDNAQLYLAEVSNIGKRKATLHLIRWELSTNSFTSRTYINKKKEGYNYRRLTNDFNISVSQDELKLALVGTMPTISLDASADKGLVLGFNCLMFNRQLKMTGIVDTLMHARLYSKILGFNKEVDPFYNFKYKLPLGSFKLRHVSFDSENSLVAVFEDTPTDQDYYFGNVLCFRYSGGKAEITTIPKISKQMAQVNWKRDTLSIHYILDTRNDELFNSDKKNKLRFYKSFKNTYETEYAFIHETFFQNEVNNHKVITLDNFSEEIMSHTFNDDNSLLYLIIGKEGYRDNQLIILGED